jgi:hypothetical protein
VTAQHAADDRDVTDELVMDEIRRTWQGIYDVGYADGSFLARRIDGGDLIGAETPAGLESAIRADYARSVAS